MQLFPALEKRYSSERQSALEAQRLAHEISFGPIVFQASRLMIKFGILQMLIDSEKGLTLDEVTAQTALSRYACQCLLESSLTIGTTHYVDERFTCSKAGWFLLNDPLVRVDMNFNHDVNYLGLFHLEEALRNGKPEGLKEFGDWSTVYEGLSQLPAQVQESWFGFDHYYSDQSFDEALQIVFADKPATLLDVGGNTGRWALRCVEYNAGVHITVMDLPQQVEMMKQSTAGSSGAERIHGYGCNLLDPNTPFPPVEFDAIWLSQFLDCFSESETVSILSRAAKSMSSSTKLYIMETFWDRQRFETAAYALTQISLYFTAIANGNSKMFHSEDLLRCIDMAGLTVEEIRDGIGKGHSIVVCRKKDDSTANNNSSNMTDSLSHIDVHTLLPQRPPFIMIDELTHFDETVTKTRMQVRADGIFVENGVMMESGIIENIAQTCAARMGYINKYLQSGSVKIGFIGAIKNFTVEMLPKTGDTLLTTIQVVSEVFSITLVNAQVETDGKPVASCQMKISITDMESTEQ